MHSSSSRLRRTGIGAAIAAVVGSGLLITPAAHAADKVLTPVDVDTSATRANGHNDFRNDGVRVHTDGNTDTGPRTDGPAGTWNTDKAAGYFDVNKALDAVGEPSLEFANSNSDLPVPGMQMKTDFDGDGDIDGILVGEPFLDGRWWMSEGKPEVKRRNADDTGYVAPFMASEPSYRQFQGTLAEWRAAFPNAQVLEGGWSLGSGAKGDGVIYSMTYGSDTYYFSKNEDRSTKTLYKNDLDLSESRTTGHNDLRPTSGIRVWTEYNGGVDNQGPRTDGGSGNWSTDKAAGYFAVGQKLRNVGEPAMAWRATSGAVNTLRPGLQLRIDVDGDGSIDGTLVGERFYANGRGLYQGITTATRWWLTGGSKASVKALAPSNDGGAGSEWNGTLAEWRAKLPAGTNVVTGGWSLGSGAKGDGIIESITMGLTTYEFTGKNRLPVAEDVADGTRSGDPVTVTLVATDPDGEALTYTTAPDPTVTIVGDQLTYTPAADTVTPRKTIVYTATDPRGGADSAEVKIDVTANAAAVPVERTVSAPVGTTVSTTLPTKDAQDDTLTYATAAEGASFDGTKLSVVVPSTGAIGARQVAYTVTDDRGAAASGFVTVNVTKASATVKQTLSSTKPKRGKKVTATVTVTSTGWAVGGRVEVYAGSKRLGSGVVAINGKAVVSLGKAKKGTYKIRTIFRGSGFTNAAASAVTTIKVK